MSLKDARLARDAAQLRVKGDRSTAGVDIVLVKRDAREEQKAVEIKATLLTFEECAEAYIRQHWSTWSEKHRNQWPSTIGKFTIPEIKPSHIYELLWQQSGSAIDLLRESASQGALTKAVAGQQGMCSIAERVLRKSDQAIDATPA